MCGRFTLRQPVKQVATEDGSSLPVELDEERSEGFSARYNIRPTQNSLVLLMPAGRTGRLLGRGMRWGLIPCWSKSAPAPKPLINARSETVADKPSFRAAFQQRRCLVPADGYYEWTKSRSGNQAYFFHLPEDQTFFIAGLWESWGGETEDPVESFTLLTTRANGFMSPYHDRMPVILPPSQRMAWLSGSEALLSPQGRERFFAPLADDVLRCHPVGKALDQGVDGPECVEPYQIHPAPQLDLGL